MAGTDAIAGPPLSNGGMMATASQQPAPDPMAGKDSREDEQQAGYMELAGAEKDADCEKVNVQGGVSQEKGCCNEFQPKDDSVSEFECGQCGYVKIDTGNAPLTADASVRSLAKGMRTPNGMIGSTMPGLSAEE